MGFFDRMSSGSQTFARMNELRRKGHGVRMQDWEIEDFNPEEPHTLVENVIDWCKRTVAECRRPYGINSFDLTLAYRLGGDSDVRSLSFKRMRPMELYDDSFANRLLEVFGLQTAKAVPLRVSAGFFSWGEAAHHALAGKTR